MSRFEPGSLVVLSGDSRYYLGMCRGTTPVQGYSEILNENNVCFVLCKSDTFGRRSCVVLVMHGLVGWAWENEVEDLETR